MYDLQIQCAAAFEYLLCVLGVSQRSLRQG